MEEMIEFFQSSEGKVLLTSIASLIAIIRGVYLNSFRVKLKQELKEIIIESIKETDSLFADKPSEYKFEQTNRAVRLRAKGLASGIAKGVITSLALKALPSKVQDTFYDYKRAEKLEHSGRYNFKENIGLNE